MLRRIAIIVPFLDDATQRANLIRMGNLLEHGGAILTTAREVSRYALDEFPDLMSIDCNAAIVVDQLLATEDVLRASQFIEKYLPESPVFLHASGDAANVMRRRLSDLGIGVYAFSRGAGVGGLWNDLVTLINSEGDQFELGLERLAQGHTHSQLIGLVYEYALRICVESNSEPSERRSLLSEMNALGLIDQSVVTNLLGMSASDFVSEIGRLSTGSRVIPKSAVR